MKVGRRCRYSALIYDDQLLDNFLLVGLQLTEIDTGVYLSDINTIVPRDLFSDQYLPDQAAADVVEQYGHIGLMIQGEAYSRNTGRVAGE